MARKNNPLATGPIAEAVAPLRIAAMQHAKKSARDLHVRAAELLAKHDWDIEKAAPYPSRYADSRDDYKRKSRRREWLNIITTECTERNKPYGGRRMHDPYYVKMYQKSCTREVLHAMKAAEGQYQAYVQKLVFKIGAGTTDARLEAFSGVWGDSLLIVRKVICGRVTYEHWRTQQIVNYSVYGLAYLQYPTRQLKG
jgi:hypothetical protein